MWRFLFLLYFHRVGMLRKWFLAVKFKGFSRFTAWIQATHRLNRNLFQNRKTIVQPVRSRYLQRRCVCSWRAVHKSELLCENQENRKLHGGAGTRLQSNFYRFNNFTAPFRIARGSLPIPRPDWSEIYVTFISGCCSNRLTPHFRTAHNRIPMNLDTLLRTMVHKGASDMHLKVGCLPHLRINGELVPLGSQAFVEVGIRRSILGEVEKA